MYYEEPTDSDGETEDNRALSIEENVQKEEEEEGEENKTTKEKNVLFAYLNNDAKRNKQ